MRNINKATVLGVIDCKIRDVSMELDMIQRTMDLHFCGDKDDIDMPKKMRIHEILTNIKAAENEYDQKKGQKLLQRYATVKYALKNLKEVRKAIMEL